MRAKTLLVLLVALGVVLAVRSGCRGSRHGDAAPGSGPGIRFASLSFEDALSRAREERTLVLVDVYTDWCGWCKKLDKEVFTDDRVGEAARGLVAIRVNAEKGGEDVASRFRVGGYPTLLFVDGDGNLVHKVEGYLPADELLDVLRALPRKPA